MESAPHLLPFAFPCASLFLSHRNSAPFPCKPQSSFHVFFLGNPSGLRTPLFGVSSPGRKTPVSRALTCTFGPPPSWLRRLRSFLLHGVVSLCYEFFSVRHRCHREEVSPPLFSTSCTGFFMPAPCCCLLFEDSIHTDLAENAYPFSSFLQNWKTLQPPGDVFTLPLTLFPAKVISVRLL